MDKIKLLLVEDETTLAMIIKETLEGEGFEITTADNGIEGLQKFKAESPDIVVADIMMPEMDGFEMVRTLRRTDEDIPVLFLTARSSVDDVVEGFNLGGNDYLRKPFSMQELIVRIKALVKRRIHRRENPEKDASIIYIGRYSLDTVNQMLSFGEDSEELSHRESELLRLLAQQPNTVVSTRDILLSLWGDDSPYNANSLQVFITKLRHHLDKDETIRIINIRGIGYKMVY